MKSAFLASFLFALVFILINLRYLSKSVDWDPATYAHNVESGTLREVFFNAHHVAHESSGLAWMKALRLIWADAPLYFGLRLRMLLWSAVFIMVIALYIARLYGDRAGGLLIAASVAFSEAFWFNAQENETALPHIFFQTLLYFLCIPGMRAGFSWKRLTVCGLAQVASIAFHQADALYIFTVPVALLLSPHVSLRRRVTTGVIYAGAVTAVVICGYLCIAMLVHRYHFEDASITRWMVAYLTLGTWGLPVGLPQKIIWTYDGIAEAFLVEMGAVKRPRVDFAHFFSPEAAPFNMLTAFWITILMLGAALFRRLWRERFAEMILLLVWVIPTILFFGWWEPYHFEYWLGQIVAMWLFSYLVLKSALPKGLPQTGKAVMRVVYLGVICILFATNLRLSIEPRSQYYSFSGASWASETLQRIRMENQRVYQNK